MSERILKALMQLFAIIATVGDVTQRGREVVELFLKQRLSHDLVEEYLLLFDKYLDDYTGKAKGDSTKRHKRTAVNSVKILRICTQINSELTQKQKFVVLFRLLEYIGSSEKSNPEELDFVSTVSETFNIAEQEFVQSLSFVTANQDELPDSGNYLLINEDLNPQLERTRHIFAEGLKGQIRIMFIDSVNMYMLRYIGDEELFLNGQLVQRGRTYVFNTGSSIRSSKMSPVYYSDVVREFLKDRVDLDLSFRAQDVVYEFPGGKIGLQEFNLNEQDGKLVGIMGASGSGKSTMLNILNGTAEPASGRVLINGIDIYKEPEKVEGMIGHVSQDDLLMEDLTVYQNLYYNARLCFADYNDFKLNKVVISTLKNLGLYEIRDMKVGDPLNKKINGGQRKRLNIALELIREPTILFVDEPTSGLSSRDSENIMDLLKELTLKGKLVFVVIHQPSSDIFKMFDKLFILDTGGYSVYYGDPIEAITYFKDQIRHVNSSEVECVSCGNVNPEQIFNILESKVLDEYGQVTSHRKISPKEWYEKFKENQSMSSNGTERKEADIPVFFKVPNKWEQFKVFITRDVLSKVSNKQYLAINLLEAPLLAFILAYLVKYFNSEKIGYIFHENDNIPAYIFMGVVVALFLGLSVSAEEIIKDRKILKRESFLNLSRSSYLYSKIAIMFVISAIQAILFVLLGNWILEIRDMNLDYFLVLFSTFCFANMLGLNISASFNSAVTIYILIPFLIIPQLLLSGVIVKFDKLNPEFASHSTVPLAGEVMASKWAYEALAVNQFKNNEYEERFFPFDKQKSNADYKKNFWIPTLEKKLDHAIRNWDDEEARGEIKNNIKLVFNEINDELMFTSRAVPFPILDSLKSGYFNPAIARKTKEYLDVLNQFYIAKWKEADKQKNDLIRKLTSEEGGHERLMKLEKHHTNENLTDLVKNKDDINKITERGNRLVRRMEPIYLDPYQSNFLRSQFFAPRKKLLGLYIDTFWANILVLWAMSVFLIITLYFDALRKLINWMEQLPDRLGFVMNFFQKK